MLLNGLKIDVVIDFRACSGGVRSVLVCMACVCVHLLTNSVLITWWLDGRSRPSRQVTQARCSIDAARVCVECQSLLFRSGVH